MPLAKVCSYLTICGNAIVPGTYSALLIGLRVSKYMFDLMISN